MSYLHGVETIDIEKGARPVKQVKTAVIGLVCTAPMYEVSEENRSVNTIKLIKNIREAETYFGLQKEGFTANKAFKAIFNQGSGTVLAINVFDPQVHKNTVSEVVKQFSDNKILLGQEGITDLVVKNEAGDTTYTEDTDYTLNSVNGEIIRIEDGAITENQTVNLNYSYADVTKVTKDEIIGQTGEGANAFLGAFSTFGYNPKILIAPEFNHITEVWSQLLPIAEKLRANVLSDLPEGLNVQEAIQSRGVGGTHNSASDRLIICYPRIKVSADKTEPLSQFLAGVMATKDSKDGYHVSPSNTEIKGIIGLERPLSASVNDPTSDVNALNEAGIVTVFNSFGTGFRTWGNRSAAYPTITHVRNFINVKRVADIVDESIEYFTLQYIDKNINMALIDAVVSSCNSFINTLIGRGALIGGECWFNKENNLDTQLANGHIVFERDILPPTPAERISYRSSINIDLYNKLGV